MTGIGKRIAIAILSVSFAGGVGIAVHEGYRGDAYTPVKGDVPTLGFGATRGIKTGDKTTPVRALVRLLSDINSHSDGIKACITVPLHQYEFDAYSSLAYNIGVGAFCKSTLVEKLNQGDYTAACAHINDFVCGPATKATQAKHGARCFSKKKPMRVLRGLENRRATEYQTCMGTAP